MPASISRRDSLPLSLPPRGLSRVEAARYVGVGPSLFDRMVGERAMPSAKRIGRRHVWDRLALDVAFSRLPNVRPEDMLPEPAGAPMFAL